jgi:hypothetical protein
MSKLFYIFLIVVTCTPFVIYQYITYELYDYTGKVYEESYITVKDYESINDLPVYKQLKQIQNRKEKCDRICRLAKYLYKKEMKRLNDWWYTWDQLVKAKKERLRAKSSNKNR